MRLLELARRPPSWLRIVFAGLVMAFVLNSIAHITHQHEGLQDSKAHLVACGYCIGLGGLVDGPAMRAFRVDVARTDERIDSPVSVHRTLENPSSAQPRAPPVFLIA